MLRLLLSWSGWNNGIGAALAARHVSLSCCSRSARIGEVVICSRRKALRFRADHENKISSVAPMRGPVSVAKSHRLKGGRSGRLTRGKAPFEPKSARYGEWGGFSCCRGKLAGASVRRLNCWSAQRPQATKRGLSFISFPCFGRDVSGAFLRTQFPGSFCSSAH